MKEALDGWKKNADFIELITVMAPKYEKMRYEVPQLANHSVTDTPSEVPTSVDDSVIIPDQELDMDSFHDSDIFPPT